MAPVSARPPPCGGFMMTQPGRRKRRAWWRARRGDLRLVTPFLILLAGLGRILFPGASAAAVAEPPVLLGLYTSRSLQETASEIVAVDGWLKSVGMQTSIAATFMDIEWPNPDWNVTHEMEAAWSLGYVPFVNLAIGTITDPGIIASLPDSQGYPGNRTAAFLAGNPRLESTLRAWARAFAAWSDGGGKKAFIAPLQEMNGYWVPYGLDPENFKLAYRRLQGVFQEEGVPSDAVSWVFAPNGWSDPRHPPFEAYYPGNSVVDVVAFSAYNYGTCVWSWPHWDTYATAFQPYLERMSAMAPSKPIFLAQTGSVDWGGDKDAWLNDSFTKLAAYPGLRAILYFHVKKSEGLPCDPVEWRFYAPSEGVVFSGVLEAMARPEAGFGTWPTSSPEWSTVAFVPGLGGNTFEDVEPAHPFSGVATVWYYDWVEALAAAGLTSGCGVNALTDLPLYCPDRLVTRAEMAIFLLKGVHGSSYRPPPPDGSAPFVDIGAHWARAWIEELYDQGLTSGYADQTYRPDNPVTRAEMAVFLLRSEHGPSYSPPAPAGGAFSDIAGHWAEAWIEQLKEEGISSGYPDGTYRPEVAVSRAEMAVFLVRAFNLPMP